MKATRQVSKDSCGAACLMMASGLRVPQGKLYSQIKLASKPLEVSTEVGIALAALENGFHAEAFRSGGAVSLKECLKWVKLCERGGDFEKHLNTSERKTMASRFRLSYLLSDGGIGRLLHKNSRLLTAERIARLIRVGFAPIVLVDDFFTDGKLPHDAHWVVVSGFSRGTFMVNDPGFLTGKGVLKTPKERFSKAIATEKHMGMQRRMVLVKSPLS